MPWWGWALAVGFAVSAVVVALVMRFSVADDPYDEETQRAIALRNENPEVWWPNKRFSHRLPDREEW